MMQPGTMSECRDFIEQYKGVEGFDIYGNTNYVVQYISDNYKNMDYDLTKIRVANIDIEVFSADGFPKPEDAAKSITAICVYDNIADKYYVWGLGDWTPEKSELDFIDDVTIIYTACASERDLLVSFLQRWQECSFHVMTGWNIEGFDIPYLVNRIEKVLGTKAMKRLSPWGIVKERTVRGMYGQEFQTYEIVGISALDYLNLYKKYTYKAQDSYTLGHIGYVELGDTKLSYEEEGSLHQMYVTNFQKYIDYNIKDVHLVKRLDMKMKLLDLVFTVAYYAKINYNDTFSPVKTWDTIIYDYLKERDIIVPPSRHHKKDRAFEGAYVKDPIVGFHDWIMSFDLNSLYPHLIMQYNLGPETILDGDLPGISDNITIDGLIKKEYDLSELKTHNVSMSANRQFFRNDEKSFLSVMMETLYIERKANKKKMLAYEQELVDSDDPIRKAELTNLIAKFNNLQMAQKILLNSAYGAIGNPYFRFFDLRIAEAVTLSGQLSIRWIADALNEYLNELLKTEGTDYVVAIDTDSNYITFGGLVDKVFKDKSDKAKIVDFLDTVAKEKIQPFIQGKYEELAEYVNGYENKMFMGREVIAERAVWTKKKRYMLKIWDSEGVRFPKAKLKFMGLEAKKSSTPEICRKKLAEAYDIILMEDEEKLQAFVAEFKSEWNQLSPDQIARPSSANNLPKYFDRKTVYRKGTPNHIKGVLNYNHKVKEKGLDKSGTPLIQPGEKVKVIQLKTPNTLGDTVISFPNYLPKELDLEKFVNYDLMFEKGFLGPLEGVLNAVDWDWEKKATLAAFF